jgi:hypothetical protein
MYTLSKFRQDFYANFSDGKFLISAAIEIWVSMGEGWRGGLKISGECRNWRPLCGKIGDTFLCCAISVCGYSWMNCVF